MSSYTIKYPTKQAAPIVFASPHSGNKIGTDMQEATSFSEDQLLVTQDSFVDKLYSDLPKLGVPLLSAHYARIYVDLNRGADEIDTEMFTPHVKTNAPQDSKLHIGLGVIPRVLPDHIPLYEDKLPAKIAENRLKEAYFPYHEALQQLIDETHDAWGRAILIDCHSMPSRHRGLKTPLADIVLGDLHGKSNHGNLTAVMETLFAAEGFSVQRNRPYAGGYCTKLYGKPAEGIEALQIEINRALYMDEATRQPNSNFSDIQQKLTRVVEGLIEALDIPSSMAAE